MEQLDEINNSTDQPALTEDNITVKDTGNPSNGVTAAMKTAAMNPTSGVIDPNYQQTPQLIRPIDLLVRALNENLPKLEGTTTRECPNAKINSTKPAERSDIMDAHSSGESTARTEMRMVHTNMDTTDDFRECCCQMCGHKFREPKSLQTHMDEAHSEPSRNTSSPVCSFCHVEFSNRAYLKEHVKAAHSAPPIRYCSSCPASYSSNWHFNRVHRGRHQRKKSIPDITCDLCQGTFKSLNNLRLHKYVAHSDTPAAFCDMCPANFTTSRNLSIHIRKQHPDAWKPAGGVKKKKAKIRHHCTQCNYSTVHKGSLNRHQREIHPDGNNRTFPCKYRCGYVAKGRRHLTVHEMRCRDAPKSG